jgi:hypothetical protein
MALLYRDLKCARGTLDHDPAHDRTWSCGLEMRPRRPSNFKSGIWDPELFWASAILPGNNIPARFTQVTRDWLTDSFQIYPRLPYKPDITISLQAANRFPFVLAARETRPEGQDTPDRRHAGSAINTPR